MASLIKYVTVFCSSMFKFIFGPMSGQVSGLSIGETILLTVGGMMATVLIFTLIGRGVRDRIMARFQARRPRFSQRSRRLVMIWRRFGLAGVAFITPIILSPIVGTVLAVSFGEPPRRIITAMLVSAVFWGVTLTLTVRYLGGHIAQL